MTFVEENETLKKAVEQLATEIGNVSIDNSVKGELKSAIKNTNGVQKNVRHVHNVLPPHAVTFGKPISKYSHIPLQIFPEIQYSK